MFTPSISNLVLSLLARVPVNPHCAFQFVAWKWDDLSGGLNGFHATVPQASVWTRLRLSLISLLPAPIPVFLRSANFRKQQTSNYSTNLNCDTLVPKFEPPSTSRHCASFAQLSKESRVLYFFHPTTKAILPLAPGFRCGLSLQLTDGLILSPQTFRRAGKRSTVENHMGLISSIKSSIAIEKIHDE